MKIATVWGVPVRLHVTVPLVCVGLVIRLGYLGVPAVILLYGSVLLHELGHALVARRFGIPTAAIDLHLLGGMALMTAPARNPSQEALVAAAGPVVSAGLGAAFGVLAVLTGAELQTSALSAVDLLAYGAAINLGMAVFNLVPALPMDGGRIFRALLSRWVGHVEATRIAAWVSRAFATLFVVVGLLLGAWSLLLIGVLLFFLVGHEQLGARARRTPRPYPPSGLPDVSVPSPASRFTAWSDRSRGPQPGTGPVIDVAPIRGLESREEYVDGVGRRYVVVTRVVR